MKYTDYHAQYYAHELTRRCASDSAEKLAGTVAGAQVDLNPHQVEAALFAFRSPLSKGALLADEVGLGKTIEAGLVISQKWAENRRTLLVITPSNLRKQWYQELTEKFFLPCLILESKSYQDAVKEGIPRPFENRNAVIICSYQFARNKAAALQAAPWDLVVMDEAHRLRNVYKPTNVIGNTLKLALAEKRKLLLTATPLQNSLLELYGLVGFIDEHTFGDLKSFKEQFSNIHGEQEFQALRDRIKPICHRTLRRQVTAYVPYTKRLPLVEEFTPQESEDRLYSLVTDYLQRPNLQALPSGQRSLMTLVLRKLLASSTFAIAGALDTISARLKAKLGAKETPRESEDALDGDYEALQETAEEWDVDEIAEPLSNLDRAALEAEIRDLESFSFLASSIQQNSKGKALLKALDVAFAKADQLGAAPKAIIFTESRRTQNYLLRLLGDSPFAEGIVLFNGSNTDEASKKIYAKWLEQNKNTDRVTKSRTADMRSALVDYFRDQGRIMIATEAGAEGINLQFCSLVVNYDLPWNPQRIEQRIGRCHRYGQKHDVVVVNFLNRKNAADQRVFQLLSEKFRLFEGVFGASDEVLGAIESGVDFEKRIAAIYQGCRQPEEIKSAFDRLQLDLSLEIDEAMSRTGRQLLENFDDEVREKLKVRDEASKAHLNHHEQLLMRLTRHELQGHAEFLPNGSFELKSNPFAALSPTIPEGLYELPRRSGHAHFYRLNHPLAEAVLSQAKTRSLPSVEIRFDYSAHAGKISVLEPFIGKSGSLMLSLFTVATPDQEEDHLIFAGTTSNGQPLAADILSRLFSLPAKVESASAELSFASTLEKESEALRQGHIARASERNTLYFEQEMTKLDAWAEDCRLSLKRGLKDLDDQIGSLRKQARAAGSLPDKLSLQRQVNQMETKRDEAEVQFRAAGREVEKRKNELVDAVEERLRQKSTSKNLFTVHWTLV